MDNAGCHPPELLKNKYGNIKITFLPANTTSKLQPLDLGIIMNFKIYYRKLLLRYIVAKIDQHSLVSDVAKNINVLQAIRRIAEAWKQVSCETLKKCFKTAGILNDGFEIVTMPPADDPFANCDSEALDCTTVDTDNELDGLYYNFRLMNLAQQEFIGGENTIPICQELNDEGACWDESFFAE